MKTHSPTQLGMVGLGRMGSNMVRRLLTAGHRCTVFDVSAKAVEDLAREGAVGASSFAEAPTDRKSTRLNSSHLVISYAVFCLKKKKKMMDTRVTTHVIIASRHEP